MHKKLAKYANKYANKYAEKTGNMQIKYANKNANREGVSGTTHSFKVYFVTLQSSVRVPLNDQGIINVLLNKRSPVWCV